MFLKIFGATCNANWKVERCPEPPLPRCRCTGLSGLRVLPVLCCSSAVFCAGAAVQSWGTTLPLSPQDSELCLSCSNLTHVSMGCELLWSWQDGLGCAYLRFRSVPCKFFIQPQTLGLLRTFLTYIGLALIPLKLDYRVLCLF